MHLIRIKRLEGIVVYCAAFTTLAVSPFWNFDPINLIKTLTLAIGSGSILYLLFASRKFLGLTKKSPFLWICVSFLFGLTIPLLLSGAPIEQQFWGVFGRNNGFFSYFCLLIILVGSFIISNESSTHRILKSLLITSFVFSCYVFAQILEKDPISWSLLAPFGTLGNVNFSSAFLGFSSVATVGFLIFLGNSTKNRVMNTFLLIFQIFCLLNTDSSQGLMVLGFGCASLFILKTHQISRSFTLLTIPTFVIFIWQFAMAFVNKGILAAIVYQETLTFRLDYMFAGIRMFASHPLTGVGLDSYGDWYRAYRGVVSAYRTGLGRSSNTAHNVIIDLAATGGLLLSISYIAFATYAFWGFFRRLKNSNLDNTYCVCFGVWFAYFSQTLISINQIGVGIWGWVLLGLLLGYEKFPTYQEVKQTKGSRNGKNLSTILSPKDSILTFFSMAIFAICAIVPLSQDAQFRTAQNKRDLQAIVNMSDEIGTSNFLLAQAFGYAYDSGDVIKARLFANTMTKRNPNDISGWQATRVLNDATPSERLNAIANIKRLDPLFPCLEPSPESFILREILRLPSEQQYELVEFWKLPGVQLNPEIRGKFRVTNLPQETLTEKLRSYCTS